MVISITKNKKIRTGLNWISTKGYGTVSAVNIDYKFGHPAMPT